MSPPNVQHVEVVLTLHPLDYAALQEASRAVRMSETDFCALAIHRESIRTRDATAVATDRAGQP